MNYFEVVISEDKLDLILSYLRSDFGGYTMMTKRIRRIFLACYQTLVN